MARTKTKKALVPVPQVPPTVKLAMRRRRVPKWGNKEWAEHLLKRLTPSERARLRVQLQVTHTRLDFAWWLARLLNHEATP